MKSPLEDQPKVLQKIGLFIVLFNLIDGRLGTEFYYVINQQDGKKRLILSFLETLDVIVKVNMLRPILGEKIYKKIAKLNEFRVFIAHGSYGVQRGSQEVSMSKMKRPTGKYHHKALSELILDEQIEAEREVLSLLHELVLKRIPKKR